MSREIDPDSPEFLAADGYPVTTAGEETAFVAWLVAVVVALALVPVAVRTGLLAAGGLVLLAVPVWAVLRWRAQHRAAERAGAEREAEQARRGADFAAEVETWLHTRAQ